MLVREAICKWIIGRALLSVSVLWLATGTANSGTYQVTVEPAGFVTVDVLDKDKAPLTAKLEIVGTAAHGIVAISPDKRSVTFRAMGDYVGRDSFTYRGKDEKTNVEYTGTVDVTIASPQRIVGLDYARVAGVLGIILVLAIVLEIGLATVFNWKYFQDNFEGAGLRTPIAVAVSGFFTYFYGLDVVADLLSAFTAKGVAFEKTLPGYVITAFIVAGGSGTVNRLFATLGLRPPVQDNAADRQRAQVVINLTRSANLAANAPVQVSIDGQIVGTETAYRLPAQGTYRLAQGDHTIKLDAMSTTSQPLTVQQQVNLASAASVTLAMTL